MQVYDVERDAMTEVTPAEARAGMVRYARSLGPGTPACAEWERRATADEIAAAADSEVSMTELQELWAELKARGELWNGMTDHYLHERYGDRVYHVAGRGWYVRPETVDEAAARHDDEMFGPADAEPEWATPGYDPAEARRA
jgi:hypothetical protein